MTVDWFRVIIDLQRAGMSFKQIAKEINVKSPMTISNWQTMVCEPRFSAGARLLELHRSVVKST